MKAKLELESGQTPEQGEEELYKALNSQRTGDIHREEFQDPAMNDVAGRMKKEYRTMWEAMWKELEAELDREYS